MLLLVFRVAGESYAVEAGRVLRVIPRVELRALPHAPETLAGLFRYRGRMVPVIDLGILLGTGPSPALLSTRIILFEDRTQEGIGTRAGLIAEHVSEVRRIADESVIVPPDLMGENPYLGSIVSTETGLVPLIAVERILAGPLCHVPEESSP
jgi:chemotaxis-related protein WspB